MTAATVSTSKRSEPRLFLRQRQLLELLHALGGTMSMLDFQQLLFLYCQERPSGDAPYDFVPSKFGACSFTSCADRKKLIERGLLSEEDGWHLTPAGRAIVEGSMNRQLESFVRRHRGLRGDALLAHAYRRFPFFAIRSEIRSRVLDGDDVALSYIRSAERQDDGPALLTLGYEGHSLESYLSLLIKSGATLLCDVRRNPLSRKYGFSKTALARSCESVGIRYEHLPELGISSDRRKALNTQEDYDALFSEYERVWLPQQGAALKTIRDWIAAGERVALTCYERAPHQCHRHCVSEAIEAKAGEAIIAEHL